MSHSKKSHSGRAYLPAAGRHWRLPFYDLLATLLGADGARHVLAARVAPPPRARVLDIGSGTGSLAIELKRMYPDAEVVGLDPDSQALAIARRKAARAATPVRFDCGFADALPYPDDSFDRMTSSFMFHHLAPVERARALREVRRVLAPGGVFHMLDFDGPAVGAGFLARRIHASLPLRDNAADQVLGVMREAGFGSARLAARRASALTHVCYYEATAEAA